MFGTRLHVPVLLVLALLATGRPALYGQDDELRKELDALREGQEAIQRELALDREIQELRRGQEAIQRQLDEIKKLLEARPAAPAAPAGPNVADVVFDLGTNPVKGRNSAPLTLIEFTDYQCPYCARFTRDTKPQIVSEYVESGKLRLAVLDLPLESIHKLAFKAAEATHCAQEQGKFWEMYDRLFESQRSLEPWSGHAAALDLDVGAFDACMESGKHAGAVRRDIVQAQRAGATGTPAFVVGRTDPEDPSKVTGITFLRGAQAFNAFKAAIDGALGAGE